jgi:20S proteasome subunit beta 7
MYNKRSKIDPLYNQVITAGFEDGKPFLGTVDLYGSNYTDNIIASGFGTHLAVPLMRKRWHEDLEEKEARKILEDCMVVCYYRDCRAIDRVIVGKVDKDGVSVEEPYTLATKWDYERFVHPDKE